MPRDKPGHDDKLADEHENKFDAHRTVSSWHQPPMLAGS
jgi:hypothetical protein